MGNTMKQTLEEDASENSENTNGEYSKNNQSLPSELSAGIPQGDLEAKPPSGKSGSNMKNCSLKQIMDGCIEEKLPAVCVKGTEVKVEPNKETISSVFKEEALPAQNFKSLQYKETIDYIIEGYFKSNKFPSKVMLQINNTSETSKEVIRNGSESVTTENGHEITADRTAPCAVSKSNEVAEHNNVTSNELKSEDSVCRTTLNVNTLNNNTVSKPKSDQSATTETHKENIPSKKVLNISAIIDQVIDSSLTKESGNSHHCGISLTTHIDETKKCSPPTNITFSKPAVKHEIKTTQKSDGSNGFLSLKDHIDSILQKSILEDEDIGSDNESKETIPKILPLVDETPCLDILMNKSTTKAPSSISVPLQTFSKGESTSSTACVTRGNNSCITNGGMTRRESELAYSLSKDTSKVAGQQLEMKKLLEIPTTHSPFRKATASLSNTLPTSQSNIRNMVVGNDSDRLYPNNFHPGSLSGSYPKHRNDIQHSQKFHSNVVNSAYQTNNSNNKNIPPLIHAGTYLAKKFGYPSVSQTFPQASYARQNLSAGFNETERGCQERINAIPPERMIAVAPERMSYAHPPSNVHNVQYQRPLQLVPQNVVKPSPIVQQNILGAQTVQHQANCQCVSCFRHHHHSCGCVQCLTEKSHKKDVCLQDSRRLDMRDFEFTKVFNKTHTNLTTTAQQYPKQQTVVGSGYLIKPNPQQSRHQDLSPLTSTYLQGISEAPSYKPLPETPSYKPVAHRESLSHPSQFESTSMYISGTDIHPSVKLTGASSEHDQFRDDNTSTKASNNCLDLSVSNKTSETETPLDLTVHKSEEQVCTNGTNPLSTFRHTQIPSQQRESHFDASFSLKTQNASELQKSHYSQLYTEAASTGFGVKSPSSTEFQSMESSCQDIKIVQSGENVANRNLLYRPSSNLRSPSISVSACESIPRSPSQMTALTNQHTSPHLSEDAQFPVPMKVATQCLSPDVSPIIQSAPQTPDAHTNGSNRTPTPSGCTDKKDSSSSRRGSISKHEPIQNILGTNLPSDVLYLICRLCGQTYGSPYGFRKHFRNQHGFEPRAEHTIVQTISATKSAMKVQEGSSNLMRHIDERADPMSVTDTTSTPTTPVYSVDNGKPKAVEYSGTSRRDTEENISTFNAVPQTVRNPSEVNDTNVNKLEETKCLECPECQQTFQLNDFGSYKRHCRQHNNTKSVGLLSCSDCHVNFQDSFEAKEHMLSHASDYFRCKVCSLAFSSSKYLQEHLKTSHSADPVKTSDSMTSGINVSHLVSPNTIIRSSDINRQPADQIGAISASPDSSTPQELGNSTESKQKQLPSCISDTVISVPDSVQDSKDICSRQHSDVANTSSSQEMNTEEVTKCDSENNDCHMEPVYKHKKFSLPRKRHDLTTSNDAPPQKINCVSSSDNVCRNSSSLVDSTQCISASEKLNVHSSVAISNNGDSQQTSLVSHNHSCDIVDRKCVKVKIEDESSSKSDVDHGKPSDITKYPSVQSGKLKFNGAEIKQEARHNLPYVWDRITRTQAGKPIKPPDYM